MIHKTRWFDKCGKAPWQPPPVTFRVVWPILYTLYILTIVLEWKNIESRSYLLLGFALNLCWVPLFILNVRFALLLLTIMIAIAVKCVFLLKGHKTVYIFSSYLAWICFAWTLNMYLAVMCVNPGKYRTVH